MENNIVLYIFSVMVCTFCHYKDLGVALFKKNVGLFCGGLSLSVLHVSMHILSVNYAACALFHVL